MSKPRPKDKMAVTLRVDSKGVFNIDLMDGQDDIDSEQLEFLLVLGIEALAAVNEMDFVGALTNIVKTEGYMQGIKDGGLPRDEE